MALPENEVCANAIVAMLNLCDSHGFKAYDISDACGISLDQAETWVRLSRELIASKPDQDVFDVKTWL